MKKAKHLLLNNAVTSLLLLTATSIAAWECVDRPRWLTIADVHVHSRSAREISVCRQISRCRIICTSGSIIVNTLDVHTQHGYTPYTIGRRFYPGQAYEIQLGSIFCKGFRISEDAHGAYRIEVQPSQGGFLTELSSVHHDGHYNRDHHDHSRGRYNRQDDHGNHYVQPGYPEHPYSQNSHNNNHRLPTCDTRHATCDTRHPTRDTRHDWRQVARITVQRGNAREIRTQQRASRLLIECSDGSVIVNTVVVREGGRKHTYTIGQRLHKGDRREISFGSMNVTGIRISEDGRGTYRLLLK